MVVCVGEAGRIPGRCLIEMQRVRHVSVWEMCESMMTEVS